MTKQVSPHTRAGNCGALSSGEAPAPGPQRRFPRPAESSRPRQKERGAWKGETMNPTEVPPDQVAQLAEQMAKTIWDRWETDESLAGADLRMAAPEDENRMLALAAGYIATTIREILASVRIEPIPEPDTSGVPGTPTKKIAVCGRCRKDAVVVATGTATPSGATMLMFFCAGCGQIFGCQLIDKPTAAVGGGRIHLV